MAVYSRESKISEALMSFPSLIPVVNRLGVNLGVGDSTIEEVCKTHGIDTDFFLSVINTFIEDEYFPQNALNAFTLDRTIDYLEKTGQYYLHVQLTNIERHFNVLIQRSGKDNNLSHLQKFFNEVKRQFEESIQYEKTNLFPRLRNHNLQGLSKDEILLVSREIEDKLEDLLTFFVVHLRGDYDRNLCMGVVTAIFSLRKDVNQNNRIRMRILIPLIFGIDTLPH